MLRVLKQSVGRVVGAELPNLVLAFRGALEPKQYYQACRGVSLYNRTEEEQERIRTRRYRPDDDFGFFGDGIYFTQFPGYGDYYINLRMNKEKQQQQQQVPSSTKSHRDSSTSSSSSSDHSISGLSKNPAMNSALSLVSEDGLRPLLLCWVVMGRTYPVDQPPTSPTGLHGLPCIPGYDSHYTLVSAPSFFPIRHAGATPSADEIVIFNPDQVSLWDAFSLASR